MEVSVQQAIDLFKTGTGNQSGSLPPNTPPVTNTNQGIFENAKNFSNARLEYLEINNNVLTGNFLVFNNDEIITQDFPAKIYVSSGLNNVQIGTFTIKPTNNRNFGSFVSVVNITEILEAAKNDKTYTITFIVKVDAFPNISYGFTKVLLPIKCPDKEYKYRQIIEVEQWTAIKDNICCNCYSKPYDGSEIIWDGKPCSKNGTTC